MEIKKSIAFILVITMMLSVLPAGIGGSGNVEAAEKTVGTFQELKAAVAGAKMNDKIIISTTGTIEFEDTIEVTTSVSIVGKDMGNFLNTKAVLSASGLTYAKRHFEVFDDVVNKNVVLSLENLTISGSVTKKTGGVANGWGTVNMTDCNVTGNAGGGSQPGGGAVYANYGTISNCKFTDNYSDYDGGAVYIGSTVINNSIFENNYTGTANLNVGGAVYAWTTTMSGCTFVNNKSIVGGGISAYESNLYNCKLNNNEASDKGGALYSEDAILTDCEFGVNKAGLNGGAVSIDSYGRLSGCTLAYNQVTKESAGNGGAVCMDEGELTDCTLSNNSATQFGGAVYSDIGKFTGCTLSGNTAGVEGGAVYGTTIKFYDCTVSDNTARDCGAINGSNYVEINNSTVFNNSSAESNSIYSLSDIVLVSSSIINNGDDIINAGQKINMFFSIVANSNKSNAIKINGVDWTSVTPQELKFHGTSGSTSEYCVAGESAGYTVNDLFGANPLPKNNGGYTKTMLPTEKVRVVPISSIKGTLPGKDQRGVVRPSSGLACMGSVELPASNPPTEQTTSKPTNVTKIYSPNKNIYIKKGKSITLPIVATATDSKSPKLTWSSSNSKIATVNQNGKVAAKKKGKAKITVKAENGKSFTFTINVVIKDKKVKKIAVKGYKKTMKKNQSKYLKVTLNPKAATNGKITFKSSKKSVLTVDKAGKITAKKKGKATITVKAGTKTKKIKITVK